MYISMVCIGAAHGLIFLPVLLSYVGKYYYITVLLSSPYMVRVLATVLVSVSCLVVCIRDMRTHKTCVLTTCN